MRQSTTLCMISAVFALLATAPASTHHSFAAEFDADKPVTLRGVVTKIEWQNPHAYIYLDVIDDETRQVRSWQVELGSPNGLRRLGWQRTTVTEGDELVIEGTLARIKPNLANARRALLVRTGEHLGASSSQRLP